MPRIGLGLGLGYPFYSSIDPAASAYFAATGLTGATEKAAVNTLVTSLKSAGLWSKMKAVYPFVTDNRNLLSYTEDFGNAYWNKFQITVTTNTTTAPNGTTTADTIQNTGSGYVATSNAALLATTYTQSCYFKKNNNNWVAIYTSDTGSNYAAAWFNINTGIVGSVSANGNFSNATSSITSVGNGWYRCVLTFTKPSSGASDTSHIIPDSDNTFTRTAGQNAYIWGAQLELGSTATTYQPIATTQQSYISNQFKYNLVNPVDSDAAFRGVFNGGWTFSNQGATPNGTNGYMDTFLTPSSVLAQNSTHLSFYSRSNILNTLQFEIGSYVTASAGLGSSSFGISYNLTPNGHMRNRVSTATVSTGFIPTDARGLFVLNRTTSTQQKAYQNGVLKETANVNSDGLSTLPIAISACRITSVLVGDYSAKQTAFSSIGDGLTDTEATALYNTVQSFNQTLQRQV